MLVKITNLDETLVEKLKEITGERTAAKAVSKAVSRQPILYEKINHLKAQNEKLEAKLIKKENEVQNIKKALMILKEL